MNVIKQLKQQRLQFEREVVATVITRSDLTLRQIADMHSITKDAVTYVMQKHGVPSRRAGRKRGISPWKREKSRTSDHPSARSNTEARKTEAI